MEVKAAICSDKQLYQDILMYKVEGRRGGVYLQWLCVLVNLYLNKGI